MTDQVWISGEQSTVLSLLDRRLETDPDGEYLDVCGTKLTAAAVADTANRVASSLREPRCAAGRSGGELIENSAEAALAWWGIVRAGAIAVSDQHRVQGRVPAPPAARLGARAS